MMLVVWMRQSSAVMLACDHTWGNSCSGYHCTAAAAYCPVDAADEW